MNIASVVTELSVVNDTAERGVKDVKMLRKTLISRVLLY